jgi:hypothetical protein
MSKKYRNWIPGIVFWTLFLGSLALGRHYPWVDSVWNAAWLMFLLVVAICATVGVFRKRAESQGYVGYRGVPRWVVTLFGGEVGALNKPANHRRTQRTTDCQRLTTND